MGLFEGERGQRFITLGNRDIGAVHGAALGIEGEVRAVRQLDKESRQWKEVPIQKEGNEYRISIEIAKGDIELLEVISR